MVMSDEYASNSVISGDGRWLVAKSGGEVRLWDVGASSSTAALLQRYPDDVESYTFSPDHRWLATGSTRGIARVWPVMTSGSVSPLPTHALGGDGRGIASIAMSADNRWLATGGNEGTVHLWNLTLADAQRTPLMLDGHACVDLQGAV